MKNLLLTLGLLIATTMGSRASVTFSENFNYPDGSIVDNSAGLWIYNSGTAGSMLVTNQQLIVSTSRSEDIAGRLGSVFTTNGPVTAIYSSFTLKATGLPTAGGAYFAHFVGTNSFGLSGFRARLWASITNVAGGTNLTGGQFMLSILNSNAGNATNTQWLTPLLTNTTYTIVTRYELATGASTLWVNPNAESDPGVTATDLVPAGDAANGPINISHYGFRQASGEGTLVIDSLKVSTAFNDIAGPNTSPSISGIPDQSTPANTAVGPLDFTISDTETPNALDVSATSGNLALVPNANITLGGSGANRTISVTPAPGQQGSAVINISVSDLTNVTTGSFTLTVGAPDIAGIENQITSVNQPITIPFTVSDVENDSLTFSTNSSNTDLISNSNIVIGGSGNNRTITLTPTADVSGNTTITIIVSDGHTTAQTSFVLTVKALLGVLFSDDFSTDPDGPLYTSSFVWGHASTGFGTGNEMQVSNGVVIVNNSLTEDVMASLAGQPYAATTGVVLYCSFTLSQSALPSSSGSYFMHYRDSAAGSTFKGKVFASTVNAASGKFRLGVANSANVVTAESQFPLDLSLNTTYTVLTRYNIGTGETRLWVNPNSETDPSVGATDAASPSIIGAIALREEAGSAPGIENLDDIKIGTSYTDVLTVTNVVVPPTLSVSLVGSNVQISWPTNAAGFNLESTVSVTPPITWGSAGTPTPVGTNNVVTITSPIGNQFYRLHQ